MQPQVSYSVKFVQHSDMSLWIKTEPDPPEAPLNMHNVIFFSTDVSEPILVCPDNPEQEA